MKLFVANQNIKKLFLVIFFFRINSGDGSFAQEDEFFVLENPMVQVKIDSAKKDPEINKDQVTTVESKNISSNISSEESSDWIDLFDDKETVAAVSVGAVAGGIGIAALIALIYKAYGAYKDSRKPKTIDRYLSEMLDYCLDNDRRSGFREVYLELSPIQQYIQSKEYVTPEEVLVLSKLVRETISSRIDDVSGRSTRGLNIRPNTRLLAKLEIMQDKIFKTLREFYEYNQELEDQVRDDVEKNKKLLVSQLEEYKEQKTEDRVRLKIIKDDAKIKLKKIKSLENKAKDSNDWGLRYIAGLENPVVSKNREAVGLEIRKQGKFLSQKKVDH